MTKNLSVKIIISLVIALASVITPETNLLAYHKLPPKKIIVIGAGLSGLAAAQNLQQKGYDVLVLEAKDYIGGRVKSETVNGERYELGASWIHGDKNNPLADILKKEGASLIPTEWSAIVYYKNGKRIEFAEDPLEGFYSHIEDFKEENGKDISLDEVWSAFAKKNKLTKDETNDFRSLLAFDIETETGADLKNISAREYEEEQEMKGGDKLVTGGYDLAIKYLAKNLNIKLNSAVNKIEDDGDKAIVTTAAGEVFSASEVIVTVPLGVLQKGSITFMPELPAYKQKAIKSLQMGNLHKTFLSFEKKFWEDADVISIFKNNETKWSSFINLEPVFKKPVLLVLHAGENAKSLEQKTEIEIGQEAYETLKTIYPNAMEPSTVVTSKWHADSFTLGSYSYVPVGASLTMYDDIGKPFGRIHFAGEHTTSEFPSTTHGAYLSGLRAANEIQ